MKIKKSLNNIIAYDVMISPFLKPLPITLLMLPGMILGLKLIFLKGGKSSNLFQLTFLVAVLISFAASVFSVDEINMITANAVYAGLLVILIVYLNIFESLIKSMTLNAEKYLLFFLYLNFVLACVFFYDYTLYFSIREFWTFGNSIDLVDFNNTTRFTGVLSDPTNAAICIVAAASYITLNKVKLRDIDVVSAMVVSVVSTIPTMSSTGFVAMGFMFFVILYKFITEFTMSTKSLIFLVNIAIGFSAIGLLFYFVIIDNLVYQIAIDRIVNNSAESRLDKISVAFDADLIGVATIGYGGTIFINQELFRPHLGHLHIILNYGLISYLIFMYVIFKPLKSMASYEYVPVFIIFLGFTVNTGFIDFRFCIISALLIAAYRVNSVK